MSERAFGQERVVRESTFTHELGGKGVRMVLTIPDGPQSGVVLPIISGLASGPELHGPVAQELAGYGHIVARVWQEGASEQGVRASAYVLQALEQGSFNSQALPLPDERQTMPIGHSLGGRKMVKALERLYAAGDTTINSAILQAPACLGGVRPWSAAWDGVSSIRQEIKHINVSGAIEYRHVAVEGLRSLWALQLQISKELNEAILGNIKPDIIALQEQGVEFMAIDHPDDRLVRSAKNQETYRELGIPYIEVEDAPFAGHNVQLYYPQQAARAIHTAQGLLREPVIVPLGLSSY